MKKVIITASMVLFLFNSLGFSEARSWCEPSVDLSKDFPKETKDQGDLGYCFAFASTSLVENYQCKNSKKRPCKSLSAMDAITQYPRSLSPLPSAVSSIKKEDQYTEGGFNLGMLETLQKNGLCSEKIAPYVKFDKLSQKEAWDLLLDIFKKHPKTSDPEFIREVKERWKHGFSCEISNNATEFVEEVLRILESSSPIDVELALNRESGRAFLQDILLPDKCAKNRKKNKFKIGHLSGQRDIYGNILVIDSVASEEIIAEKLKSGKPLAIQMYCGSGNPICDEDGAHAVVIKGMRKNPDTGLCEYLILNSWGGDWQETHDGGYFESDIIGSYIYDLTWIQ